MKYMIVNFMLIIRRSVVVSAARFASHFIDMSVQFNITSTLTHASFFGNPQLRQDSWMYLTLTFKQGTVEY